MTITADATSPLSAAESTLHIQAPAFFRLRPPAPIRLLSATWDRSHNPPRAMSGHVELEYPVNSDIVASQNLYAVTSALRDALEASDLTGFTFGPLAVTRSHHLLDYAAAATPALHTLVLTGRACRDDIAPWRCDSVALSRRAALLLWKHDPTLLPFTTTLDAIR